MVRCRFCDYDNPAGARRCASCGAELPEVEGRDAAAPAAGDSLDAQVLALLASRGKIAAIKLHRERTGAGLKESKDAVEALARRHGVVPAQSAGCAGMLVLALVLTGALAAL